jgi:beta-aspartyl-peptidase (threonine type)
MRAKFGVLIGAAALLAMGLPTVTGGKGEGQPGNQVNIVDTAIYGDQPAQSIAEVLTAQQTAWNRGDIPAFLEGYWNSPELTFAGSDGITRGYDGVLARYRKSYPDRKAMGDLEFSALEIRPLSPEAALVLGHWHLKRQSDELGGVFTLVFERFPSGWRIIHDHTSAQKQIP